MSVVVNVIVAGIVVELAGIGFDHTGIHFIVIGLVDIHAAEFIRGFCLFVHSCN